MIKVIAIVWVGLVEEFGVQAVIKVMVRALVGVEV
jgi:hypothetical protein